MKLTCTCRHAAQDRMHGYQVRVHNWARKAMRSGAWRCTVCSTTRQLPRVRRLQLQKQQDEEEIANG